MLRIMRNESNIEFVNDKLQVPDDHATHWCISHLLPQEFTEKQHHLIGYEAVISPQENEQIVRLLFLF